MLTHQAFFSSPRAPVSRQFELDLSVWTTPREIAARLRCAGMVIEEKALALLQTLAPPPPQKNKLVLKAFTVEQIGLPDGGDYGEVIAAARKRGLRPGASIAGPLLRLAYGDQPKGEALRVAISGHALLFVVRRDGDALTLSWDDARPTGYWDSERTFLFMS